jgi:O-antigen ligase
MNSTLKRQRKLPLLRFGSRKMKEAIRLDLVLLALVAAAWLPANHYLPWLSAWQEGIAILAVGCASAALSRAASLPGSWGAVLLLALTALVVQALSGHILFAGDVWMVALYLLALVLALMTGAALVDDACGKPGVARLELLCLALLAAALASAGIGFAQWAGVQRLGIFGADLPPNARPFANFGQPNHWCTASLIGLASAWVLYESRRIGALTLGLVAAVLLTAMVMSGSRTAWLQLGLGLVLFVFLSRQSQLRLRMVPVLVALGAVAMAWMLWPLLLADAGEGSARTVAQQASAGLRLPLWIALLDAIGQRPWAGYGWQQMTLAQQAVALDHPPLHVHFEHAHNLLLDLMIWLGVPMALLIIGLASWALLRLVLATRDPRAAGLLLAVGGVLAHSMVEFAIEYAYFLLPMALMLGAAHRLAHQPAWQVPRGVVRAGGVLALGMLTLTALDYLAAESSYRSMRLESARVGATGIESAAPQLRVLTQLEAFLAYARDKPVAGASAESLARHERVAARFAYPAAQFRLALWQALNGRPAAASRTLHLSCAMHRPHLCSEAIHTWTALQAEQPALRAVSLPPLPR